ncbi:FG-GAP repeat domain-containing protein [Streptomyces sp. NPDC008317]|uniref:FG-GAP repeat domain-containing protein n=1 Tax=Streptomyces sp. NPDC008317 TaxID=3364827 RepID=UPI0036DFE682
MSSLKFFKTERECTEPSYGWWLAEKSPVEAGFGDIDGDRYADVLSRDLAGRLWFVPGSSGRGRLIGPGWNSMKAMTRHGDFTGDGIEDRRRVVRPQRHLLTPARANSRLAHRS